MEAGARHNILVKAPNWLGDLVLFTPALRALRGGFPESAICVVGNGAARDVVSLSQLDLEFFHFDRHKASPRRAAPKLSGISSSKGEGPLSDSDGKGSWRAAVSALRRRSWAIGITFAEGFSSALLLRMAGAQRTLGYRGDGRRLLLSTALSREPLGHRPHLAREHMRLARAAGVSAVDETPSLAVPGNLMNEAQGILKGCGLSLSGPLVGICPGAAYGPSKRWPPERFARAGAELAESGAEIAVFGAHSEASLASEVAGAIPGAFSVAGKTSVMTLAACLARCAVVIANDSGAAHLAAAVGTPVVAVFTSSDPSWTRPLGKRVRVLRADPECAPCFEKKCDLGYPCLTGVAPNQVVETALSLMDCRL